MNLTRRHPLLVVPVIVAGMSLGGGAGYSLPGKARAGDESRPHKAARIRGTAANQ
jgi:hypothetical protein